MFSDHATIPTKVGIGLRAEHYADMDSAKPAVGWLEVHTENYFGQGGIPHHYLQRLRQDYPLSFHGVGLSIGSVDELNSQHLNRTRELIQIYEPGLVSEHLSWGSVNGQYLNDLLPLPYTQESLIHFCSRVDQVQTSIGRQILIENPSTYLTFVEQEFTETEFLNQLCERTGCGLLLDVNNVYVCATNHNFSATAYIDEISPQVVGEIHLAGHTCNRFEDGSLLIDTHNQKICEDVWSLYEYTIHRIRQRPTLIEWDTDLPALAVLLEEAQLAQRIMDKHNAVAA